ncbi:ABC transporter substrate-binding protein [Planomicrobium sp. CPCC 101079]|uniref:ABC transporter substrate-binding protein n=1 Tax=Planomicrobium sp. CPCC 101079 TaxID=2599618 RepID=UPI00210404A9|nr:ABC transporter substrate-binding protein [Planomicrobium sp. CPCC 101079]
MFRELSLTRSEGITDISGHIFQGSNNDIQEPAIAAGSFFGVDIFINVNEGLFRLNQENTAEPAITQGEPEVSEDGLVYTFKLRKANWHDGNPVTADDFVFAWQWAIDHETGSSYEPYMIAGL